MPPASRTPVPAARAGSDPALLGYGEHLATGAWQERRAGLLGLSQPDRGYRLVVPGDSA